MNMAVLVALTLLPAQAPELSKEADAAFAAARAHEVDGNEKQAEESYRLAAELTERLLGQFPRQGLLHYNAGSAYHAAGDLAPARLHYALALQTLPMDDDLQRNVGLLTTEMGLDPPPNRGDWLSFLPVNLRWILGLAFVGLGLVLVALRFLRPNALWSILAVLFIVIGLPLSIHAGYIGFEVHPDRLGVVVSDQAIGRERAGENFSSTFTDESGSPQAVPQGELFVVLREERGWVEVDLIERDGQTWLLRESVHLQP